MNEGNVIPPLKNSYNDICSFSFAGFHWLHTMRDQQHVFVIAVCLLPCLVKDSQCVHVNIMSCLSHTHACMGKQQSCRRECSCSMSGGATLWRDPLNNRCSHTHSGKYPHDQTHTHAHSDGCPFFLKWYFFLDLFLALLFRSVVKWM